MAVKRPATPKTFNVDAIVDLPQVSFDFVRKTEELAPFGQGNPSPIFVISDVWVSCVKILKEQHISVVLSDDFGNTLRGIAFRCVGTTLEDALLNTKNTLQVLGELGISVWNNTRSVNFLIRDVAENCC